jgi:hypothetical protein
VVGHPLLLLLCNNFSVLLEGLCPLHIHEVVYLMILVCWFLSSVVLEGSVLWIALLFSITPCSVGLLEWGLIL